MVRIATALFAIAGITSVFTGVAANVVHDARSAAAAHSKMIKVRNHLNAPVPALSKEASNVTTTAEEVVPRDKDGKDWKRDSNFRFTYYKTGEGACGGWNNDGDYIVALNSAQFGNGENCWKKIGIWINGKQTEAQIVDECPGCPYGGLDFSPGLFSFFSDLGVGVLYGSWWFQ